MAELPMVGARVPQEWQQQISAIAAASGRKEAEVVREALGQYLGKTDPDNIKGAIADLQDRVAFLEQKLTPLERSPGVTFNRDYTSPINPTFSPNSVAGVS
jgi:RHH-type rel operon transcriptional repressor/antitoxin RelB